MVTHLKKMHKKIFLPGKAPEYTDFDELVAGGNCSGINEEEPAIPVADQSILMHPLPRFTKMKRICYIEQENKTDVRQIASLDTSFTRLDTSTQALKKSRDNQQPAVASMIDSIPALSAI